MPGRARSVGSTQPSGERTLIPGRCPRRRRAPGAPARCRRTSRGVERGGGAGVVDRGVAERADHDGVRGQGERGRPMCGRRPRPAGRRGRAGAAAPGPVPCRPPGAGARRWWRWSARRPGRPPKTLCRPPAIGRGSRRPCHSARRGQHGVRRAPGSTPLLGARRRRPARHGVGRRSDRALLGLGRAGRADRTGQRRRCRRSAGAWAGVGVWPSGLCFLCLCGLRLGVGGRRGSGEGLGPGEGCFGPSAARAAREGRRRAPGS